MALALRFLLTIPACIVIMIACMLPANVFSQSQEVVSSCLTRRNLGLRVNSTLHESKPVIAPDGTRLYFARKHSPDNTGGLGDPQDIWVTSLREGTPAYAMNSKSMNSAAADNLCGVLKDETFVFFHSSGKHTGHFVKRNPATREVVRIGPSIRNESPYLEASVSVQGDVIVYAACTNQNTAYQKGNRERDIYVITKQGGEWSAPMNLGPRVNSSRDEYSPFLSHDGNTLFFASDRPDSHGGVDIYFSRRIGPGWNVWTAPTNAGPEINTEGFDGYLCLHPDGKTAFVVSSSGAYGRSDIFAVELPENIKSPRANEAFCFAPLLFQKGKSVLMAESHNELERIAGVMSNHPSMQIEVHGHTDSHGRRSDLFRLAENRVEFVRSYLTGKGIDGSRIAGVRHGPEMPLAKNDSEENRRRNRRVELIITGM
jgi:Tol biopolymer transport system component